MGRLSDHEDLRDVIHEMTRIADEREIVIMLVGVYSEMIERYGERRARLMLRMLPVACRVADEM